MPARLRMRFALVIALSHLRSRKHDAGVSVITLISTVGVTVGVTALLMVLAVMEGFEIDLREKILGSNAHVLVLQHTGPSEGHAAATAQVTAVEGVQAAAPFLYTEAMIRSEWANAGVVVKGIDPARTAAVTDIAQDLVVGPPGPLSTEDARLAVVAQLHAPPPAITQDPSDTEVLPGVIVGEELAMQLKVYPGDKVYIINPIGGGSGPMGVPVPRVVPFRVAGVFHSGMYEYDTKWTYVTLADAQAFLQVGDVATGIEVRLDDFERAGAAARAIEAQLGFPFYTRNWKELNQPIFAALRLEKIVAGLILSLITLVASLNIVGSLILVVVTRAREIAILRALGASAHAVRMVFMLEGLVIGVVGSLTGTALGLLGCWALARYEFPLDTDVYYLDTLPVVVEPLTVLTVSISAVLIAFFATLYPATVAARIDPVEGLRYE